jgi:chromosome segregation ATPase
MPSEDAPTVPRMGSFKRALFGYRRTDVDAALMDREERIANLQKKAADALERWREAADQAARCEREAADISGMVVEREREIRALGEKLKEADERHERSITSLESVAASIDEIHSQARGQATRIRMKALREAVEVGRRAQELADANAGIEPGAAQNGGAPAELGPDIFEGPMRLEIGPLGDFSQLVGIEDAISRLGAADISVERFSEGRATLSMNLEQPIELLRELEESAPMEFRVRRTADDSLILDVDEDPGPGQQAA